MKKTNRFQWEVRPLASPENTVAGNKFRFTVLHPNLIRMEYSEVGNFEDRASQVAFFRDFPACPFTLAETEDILKLETDAMCLTYRKEEPFAEDTLSVRLKIEPASTWNFGDDFEDLGGTWRTLDKVDGECPVGRGVCSRNGFSVLDDSNSLVLEKDGWIGVRNEGGTDCYFFGFGFDYIGAVQALYRLTGVPPLLPSYALGNWWSRYYAYSQQEYLDLMDRFRQENCPFSVGVVDMDWHITKIPEELRDPDWQLGRGWTGYSWNKELFPDYQEFLRALHKRNLKTALNLHPAAGTCCHEDMYPEMAKANGIDPETKQRVPLDILSPKHMGTYFDILHHPYEDAGVDFWWMDWQQGTNYWWIHEANKPGQFQDPRERVDPLWQLNHLHILDITRDGKRPMFFSRYSGPGSHRYPVGFSGDTAITWASLRFQPWFTSTASNIGYSWWSHDIGGHMLGACDEQLYIRWLQYGVFSPINRLHSSCNKWMFKEPWEYGEMIGAIAGRWLRLRHSLFPYIYTMNYRNHTELLPLVQPMYYSHPKCSGAYEVRNQYWFGSELIAAPITEKNDEVIGMGKTELWLPKGNWFDFFTGLRYASRRGRKLNVYRRLEDMPVFAKAGAIVPMARYEDRDNRLENSADMEVLVFPGQSNAFALYEDAGDGHAYQDGSCVRTEMSLQWGKTPVFTIAPALGDMTLIPEKRCWRIGLRGFHKDLALRAEVNKEEVHVEIFRDAKSNTLWITVEASVVSEIRVTVEGAQLIHDNGDAMDRCGAILGRAQCMYQVKQKIWESLNDFDKCLWDRLRLCSVQETKSDAFTGAAEELLSLTEDKYLGSEIPEA